MKCSRWITKKTETHHYDMRCDRPAKFIVKFKGALSGSFVTEHMCKMHLNAHIKNCKRVEKLTGWDSKLEYQRNLTQNQE